MQNVTYKFKEQEKWGALVPSVPAPGPSGQKKKPQNKRGGQKHQKGNGQFQKRQFPKDQKTHQDNNPAKKQNKRGKEGFRPVSDQK